MTRFSSFCTKCLFFPSSPVCPLTFCHSLEVLQVWETQIHISVSHPCSSCDQKTTSKPPLCGTGSDPAVCHGAPSAWAIPFQRLGGQGRPCTAHQLHCSLSLFQSVWEMTGNVFALRENPALINGPQFYRAYSKRN